MIYTYEVLKVDQAARCMEVSYTHATHGTIHVGVRLPFDGEALEYVIRLYAPLGYWRDLEKSVLTPAEGTSGVIQEQTSAQEQATEFNEVTL